MMVIAIIMLLVAMNHFRQQRQSRIAQEYQYKFEALRDQLYWEAMEGEREVDNEAYRFLDYMLARVAARLPKMSIWSLVGEILVTRRQPGEDEHRLAIESKVYQDDTCREIYHSANKLWLESMRARHKYSFSVAAASLLPIIGLAQLYHQYYRNSRSGDSQATLRTVLLG